jgi:hypothetical protein
MLAMFWPYRPREGFPVVPRWLALVSLVSPSAGLRPRAVARSQPASGHIPAHWPSLAS